MTDRRKESALLTKLRQHLDAWPLCPPKDEREYSAGSVLFVNRNDTLTPTKQRMINCVERTNEKPIHLGECQGFDAAVGLSAAVPVVGAGVGGHASSQSSVNFLLHDRICEQIPLGDIFAGVDTLFCNHCKKHKFILLERARHPEVGDGSRVFAVVSKAHVAWVTSEMVSSRVLLGEVQVDASTLEIASQAGFQRGMSQKLIQRGIVGIELLCYKVKYVEGKQGIPEKISNGVPVKTNPVSTTIMQVMQGRTYLSLVNLEFDKEATRLEGLIERFRAHGDATQANSDLTLENAKFEADDKRLEGSLEQFLARGDADQANSYLSLENTKLEAEVKRLEGLIKQRLARTDDLLLKSTKLEGKVKRLEGLIAAQRILGLVAVAISCLMCIYFGFFERRKKNRFGFFERRKKNQDVPTGTIVTAAFVVVIIGLIPWLLSKPRRATGQGLTVLALVILPCIATSLDTQCASHAPWEQVALVAVTFAFLFIISDVKWWQDGGGNVQQSKPNLYVERNLPNNESSEALLLDAPGDLYNDDLDHLLSWVYIKPELAALQAVSPRLMKLQASPTVSHDESKEAREGSKSSEAEIVLSPDELSTNDDTIKDFEQPVVVLSKKDNDKTGKAESIASAYEAPKKERETVLEAVKKNSLALDDASEALQNYKESVLEAVKKDSLALTHASKASKNDREIVLEAVKKDGYSLEYASKALKNDRDLVLEAVKKDGFALTYASKALQNDREIVLEAVKNGRGALLYASEALKNDRELVLEAVKKDGFALVYASKALKNDREIVFEAVKKEGFALTYASAALKSDSEFVLEAVKKNGFALEYASEALQNDREFVLEAVKRDGFSLKYASEFLQNDREFVLKAVKNGGAALKYASTALKNDREIVLEAVKENGLALKYAPEALQNDREVVLEAVKENVAALAYSSEALQNDREFVLEAVKNGGGALEYASEALKKDRKLCSRQ